jgi:hypothetical protein
VGLGSKPQMSRRTMTAAAAGRLGHAGPAASGLAAAGSRRDGSSSQQTPGGRQRGLAPSTGWEGMQALQQSNRRRTQPSAACMIRLRQPGLSSEASRHHSHVRLNQLLV